MELEEEELARHKSAELPAAARLPEVHLVEVGSRAEKPIPVAVGDSDPGLHAPITTQFLGDLSLGEPVRLAKKILLFSQKSYFPPDPYSDFGVHIEEVHGGTANVRKPDDAPLLGISKMLVPPIGARMEQSSEETGFRVETRKIGTFLAIAEVTRERQIVQLVPAAMLPRYDVLDVKGEVRIKALVNPAILATLIRPRPNESLRLLIHYGQARARALSRMYATKSMYSTYLSYSTASSAQKRALVRLGREIVQASLELRVGLRELREMPRELRRETPRQVIHEPFQGVGGVTHIPSLLRCRAYRQ